MIRMPVQVQREDRATLLACSLSVLNETAEDWDRVIETQLNAVFLLSKLAAQSMLSRKAGKIVNIGSMYSFFGSGLVPSYSAAKGAIVQLTKSMAIELAPHNIQVNAIAPGWIETDMTAPGTHHAFERRNPFADSGRSLGSS
jgi:2-deoxy-D-gluconate 3-dehydrogenase